MISREANEYQQGMDHNANCCNFEKAYLCNPDVIKLMKQPLTYLLLAILIGSWVFYILMNQRFTYYEEITRENCTSLLRLPNNIFSLISPFC